MQCISIMSIPRPNGRGSRDRVDVPCGKCAACLSNRRNSWAYRLEEELKKAETASFITLTYNEKVNTGSLSKIDVQRFLKRLRERCYKVNPLHLLELDRLKLRYFLTGEYGSKTMRPHYHMILFNHPVLPEMELYDLIGKTWNNGYSYIGTVTPASISYVAKYLLKGSVTPEGCEEPFSLMSRRPGIGIEYVERMQDWHHQDITRFYAPKVGGQKVPLPRYYKDKIYCENSKEKNKEDVKLKMDKLENERLHDLFESGANPFLQELNVKNDQKRKLDIIIKKEKL